MLTKFETKSNRVKGLSFHPTRPWILASLHVGVIQLWDYRMGTLLDRFDEHDGPVRGIDFHKSQPLFVSGGDDYKIKVWNYKLRRCLFTLLDHMDYVRTVQFHDENPWILSASDDQTVKIWNWMSRTCIATLTGHNHYVMCAAFHPKEDLVMSASLDQTVRVWDISGLRMKSSAGGSSMSRNMNMQTNDLFGDSNASVKWQLEGHDRGVNWCSFHPSLPLFVSGADDKHVKLWRHNDSKAWEVDTFRGHFNNVSCVLFHPRQDMMISNSEDKSIRVWDIQKRTCLMTFRRESDRFWILAAHPRMNLFAAGHDNGMIVFKLQRERPGMVIYGDQLYYVKDRYIRLHEPLTGRDVPIMPIRRSNTTAPPRSLSYNPAENAVLITWDGREAGVTAGTYELYTFPKDSRADPDNCKRGLGLSAIFVARNRFAVLDNAQKLILIKNLENEVTKRCPVPHATTDGMFYAGTGMLLLRADDRVALYNVQRRAVLAELATPRVKYVYWSEDMSLVALLCKHAIIICNKKLEALCTIHETIRLKSGQWDGDVFIYTTLNHVKYCLPSGDSGTIRTLEFPIYLTFVKGDTVYALDRQIKTRILKIDPTEYRFKLALAKRKYDVVRAIIKSNRLVGKSIVAYLQAKGFPDVALHLVKDELTRFSLAVECGDIGVAHEAAKVLDTAECWHRLGVEALRQGNHTVVEMAYQRTKNFARLSFLYLITGNTTNLGKMLTIAGMRKDIMSRFHNALYLGDMTALVNVLLAAGQTQLAYIAAVAYGLADTDELRDTLAAALQREGMEPPADLDLAGAQLLLPPTPILRPEEESWPLLTRSRGYFEGAVLDDDAMAAGSDSEGAGWGSDSDIGLDSDDGFGAGGGGGGGDGSDDDGSEGDGWGSDDSMDLGDLPDPGTAIDTSVGGAESGGLFVPPAPGPPLFGVWADNSTLVVDAVAAGAFESAMGSLSRQIGAVNFEPMRDMFVAVYSAARASLPMGEQTVLLPLNRNHEDAGLRNGLPAVPTSLNALLENLQTAYKATKEGKFKKAREEFTTILMSIPFVRVESNAENSEALDLVAVAREYLIGLMLLAAQKEAKDAEDPKRQIELGAYFSHCNLQPAHLKLALDGAMKTAYKFKNLGTAAVMAKRLLDLGPGAKFAGKARKVLGASTENGKPKDNAIEIDYDEKNPFVVCCKTLVPIYRGSPMSRCGYCMAAYQPDFKGELCTVCNVAAIGAETSGLVLRA